MLETRMRLFEILVERDKYALAQYASEPKQKQKNNQIISIRKVLPARNNIEMHNAVSNL